MMLEFSDRVLKHRKDGNTTECATEWQAFLYTPSTTQMCVYNLLSKFNLGLIQWCRGKELAGGI